MQWCGPTRKLSQVNSRTVTAWAEERGKARAPETIHKDVGALRSLFAWAVARGFAETNPATAVVAPKIRRVRRQGLSIEEVRGVLERVRGSILEPVYLLAFFQGLRRGEIARARFEDAVKARLFRSTSVRVKLVHLGVLGKAALRGWQIRRGAAGKLAGSRLEKQRGQFAASWSTRALSSCPCRPAGFDTSGPRSRRRDCGASADPSRLRPSGRRGRADTTLPRRGST